MSVHASACTGASHAPVASSGYMDHIISLTEAITLLTAAIERPSVFHSVPSPPEPIQQPRHSVQHWYRTQHSASRSKENEDCDIVAGNSEWVMETEDDIALHFGEFHSDKTSRKDTALISVTHDPIRAIKAAHQVWEFESFDKRDPTQVFIFVIQSTDLFSAKNLKDKVLEQPLSSRLSREARTRLNEPRNACLYDSEGLFVSRIPKEQIKAKVSLQDLFDRKLLDHMLPELSEKHEHFRLRLGPSMIRNRISSRSNPEDTVRQFKMIYCALAKTELNVPKQSALIFAQQLMQGDPSLEPHIKEAGLSMLRNEIGSLGVRRRRVQLKFVEDST